MLYGHAAHSACLVSFKFARFSLSDRWYRYRYFLIANILIISFRNEKNATLLKKNRHCISRYKSRGFHNTNVGTFRYLLREENKESVFLKFLPGHLVQPLLGFHLLVKPSFIRCLQLTQKSFVHHHLIKRWQRSA